MTADFWIIGATIVASIAIYAAGKGKLAYIDALMFASGANTQAGLNPVDVNLLNGFQQAMIYLFAMTSNPITMHACVVFLRLYWFEKRFQSWAREVRSRRPTFTKSKNKARGDLHGNEQGVNGRHITLVPENGRKHRITNDGILLEDDPTMAKTPVAHGSDESDTTTDVAEERGRNGAATEIQEEHESADALKGSPERGSSEGTEEKTKLASAEHMNSEDSGEKGLEEAADISNSAAPGGISFAQTVKRSDGMEDDATNFSQHRSNAEHIAILERQRNQDNEVLRIPGPRDAERGLGPRRLQENDMHDDDEHALALSPTVESRMARYGPYDPRHIRERQPTITIAEPEHRRRDELADDVKAAVNTVDALRFRKPRLLNRSQNKLHEDPDDPRPVRASRTRTLETIRSVWSSSKDDMPYLSYTATTARNSNFVGLTFEQREELGGIEYRSLRTLAVVLLTYFWGFQLIILSCLLPYILHQDRYGKIVEADGVSRTWWAFFTSNGAFMDVGFSLTPDSMNSFQTSEFVLMIMWLFIIIGNTGFPVMLRFLIWAFSKITPSGSGLWEELRFLLDHPRRCFTLLFPSGPNWWLFWILVALNAIDLLFFIVLDLGSEPITHLPLHNRVVIGFFQAASTRTAGFSAVNMSDLHPAMPVLYMIMMYISVFPIAISIRRTNVYEEKSLGVYQQADIDDVNEASALSYVGTHLRRQLSFDLWYVFLGFFVVAISEGSKIQAGDFDLFAILFEVVSAYGTVGLSMGMTGINASLCSQFNVVGKLVIVAMQIRGRHRGLPYGLDRAILLPSESRFRKEAEEAEAALARVNTVASGVTSGYQRRASVGASGRSRSRSRERIRTNSNLVTKFLHPGPVVPRGSSPAHQRMGSTDSHGDPLGPIRTYTEPVEEENLAPNALAPQPSSESSRPGHRRADSMPVV